MSLKSPTQSRYFKNKYTYSLLAFYAFFIFHLWFILDGSYVLEPALVILLILNLKQIIFLDSVENEAMVQGTPVMFNIL